MKDEDSNGHLDNEIQHLHNTHSVYYIHSYCNPLCSVKCRFFSECPKNSGFCSFMEQRELSSGAVSPALIAERVEHSLYAIVEGNADSSTEYLDRIETVFWRFPAGKGGVQPWRRRLWDYRNKN